MRTQQLLDLIFPHKTCSSYAALLENHLLLRTPEKQTSRTIYRIRRIIMVKPRAILGADHTLFGRSFYVDVALIIPPDGGAKSVVQHRQQRFYSVWARLERAADRQRS